MFHEPPLVSIVVPVYNAEETIESTLKSVRDQTFQNIEIVAVDDGSTDKSLKLLKEIAAADNRMTVVEQPHSNAGVARNRGLDTLRGDYAVWFDADDYMHPQMIEASLRAITDEAADVCMVGGIFTGNLKDPSPIEFFDTENSQDRRIFVPATSQGYLLQLTNTPVWNKIYRTRFILDNNIRFQEITRTNDLLFNALSLVAAERVVSHERSMLWHRLGRRGSLHTTSEETVTDPLRALVRLRYELVRRGHLDDFKVTFARHVVDIIGYALSRYHDRGARTLFHSALREWGAEHLDLKDLLLHVNHEHYADWIHVGNGVYLPEDDN